MITLDNLLKKRGVRYSLDENYPEEIANLSLSGIYVLPDKGLVFDPYRTLDYNKITQLMLFKYTVIQSSDIREIESLLQ